MQISYFFFSFTSVRPSWRFPGYILARRINYAGSCFCFCFCLRLCFCFCICICFSPWRFAFSFKIVWPRRSRQHDPQNPGNNRPILHKNFIIFIAFKSTGVGPPQHPSKVNLLLIVVSLLYYDLQQTKCSDLIHKRNPNEGTYPAIYRIVQSFTEANQ